MAPLPDTTRTEQSTGRRARLSGAPAAARGRFWTLFRASRATAGAGERPDAPEPRPARSPALTPPGALPPWQYRPGWND